MTFITVRAQTKNPSVLVRFTAIYELNGSDKIIRRRDCGGKTDLEGRESCCSVLRAINPG